MAWSNANVQPVHSALHGATSCRVCTRNRLLTSLHGTSSVVKFGLDSSNPRHVGERDMCIVNLSNATANEQPRRVRSAAKVRSRPV
jgi:hypothetical protein